MATLTFVYADRSVVLGPMARQPVPGCYDLCVRHASSSTAPRGWKFLRLPQLDASRRPSPDQDDLLALAEAVREIGFGEDEAEAPKMAVGGGDPGTVVELARRGHLRVIADAGRLQE